MSDVLEITAVLEGERVRFYFDQCAADDVQGMGYEVGPYAVNWSDDFTLALRSAWDGVTNVELAEDCWSLAFNLRPGVTLERAISTFMSIFTHFRPSLKHAIVRVK